MTEIKILIIGATNSGKTSLINKFLKNDILPINRKPNTYINIEIESSEKSELIINEEIINKNIKENIELLNSEKSKSYVKLKTEYKYEELKHIKFTDSEGFIFYQVKNNKEKYEKFAELVKNNDYIIFLLTEETPDKEEFYKFIEKYNKNIIKYYKDDNFEELKNKLINLQKKNNWWFCCLI